jgi:hypothetical protein
MSEFWQNLGAAVGIGACRLVVQPDDPVVMCGEPARGRVRLTGGDVPQQITALTAAFMEHWTTAVSTGKTVIVTHHYRSHGEVVLARDVEARPGETMEFSFELQAPAGGDFGHDWFIGARASIPSAVDRGAAGPLRLAPPRVIWEAAAVLARTSRLEVASWSNWKSGVRLELKPDAKAKAVLDGIRLELEPAGSQLKGNLVVNPQEHTVLEVLESLVQGDRELFELTLSADDPEAAVTLYEQALRPYTDALAQLPIPSSAAPTKETLPRPGSAPLE